MDCDGLWRIVTITSFSDAKTREYGLQKVGGGYFAGYFAKVVQALSYVYG